jgi:hypothetical protein
MIVGSKSVLFFFLFGIRPAGFNSCRIDYLILQLPSGALGNSLSSLLSLQPRLDGFSSYSFCDDTKAADIDGLLGRAAPGPAAPV